MVVSSFLSVSSDMVAIYFVRERRCFENERAGAAVCVLRDLGEERDTCLSVARTDADLFIM